VNQGEAKKREQALKWRLALTVREFEHYLRFAVWSRSQATTDASKIKREALERRTA
jgi:hypothetical protein